VYALACISYVLLTVEHPFQCRNALAARKARQEPRRPPGISFRHWRTLKAALSFDRKHRPTDAQVWVDRFPLPASPAKLPALSVLMAEPLPPRSIRPWLTCTLIALVAGALWWWSQSDYSFASNTGNESDRVTAAIPGTDGTGSPGIAPAQPAQPVQLNKPATPAAAKTAPAATPVAESQTAPLLAQTAEPPAASAQVPPQSAQRPIATPQSTTPADAQIEMAARSVEVPIQQAVASVPVHRRHSYRSGISFTWSTEPGTARPGQDFVPVKSRTEYMPAGDPETRLLVPIVADPRRNTARTFYVVINTAEEGASLGSRTLTMVTIPAAD
jgi:hypothetical protein